MQKTEDIGETKKLFTCCSAGISQMSRQEARLLQRHLFPAKKQHLTWARKFRKSRLTMGHSQKPRLRACRKKRNRKQLHPQRLLRIPWRRRQNQPLLRSLRKPSPKKLLQQRRWSQPHRPQRKLRSLRIPSPPQNLRKSPLPGCSSSRERRSSIRAVRSCLSAWTMGTLVKFQNKWS